MIAEWAKNSPPKYNAAVDAFTPLSPYFHEFLSEFTEGRYQAPTTYSKAAMYPNLKKLFSY